MTAAAHRQPEDGPSAAAPRLGGRWQVNLLGRVEARNGELLVTRFNSQPTAALLARLALQPQRMHPREELAELLWPGVATEVGRNRLRQALSTLRRLLEPPGSEGPPVLLADRLGVRVNEEALACDAVDFERLFRQQRTGAARELYRGELMPGFYDEWVQEERTRLQALYDRIGPQPQQAPAAATPDAALPAAAAVPLLPSFLSRFFGREAECAELLAAIGQSRLVTLTGVGGCGKTRLALEVAQQAAGYEWVAFAPLADCRTPAQVLAQLRSSLQLAADAPDALAQVAQVLAQRRVLLVLDNFEQLVAGGGSELVEALLQRAPALHLLVTSRRALGLAGERELPLAEPSEGR